MNGLANGMFVKIDTNGDVILTAADCDTKLKVVEKTTLWRKDALVLDVIAVGADEIFLVENEWEVYEDTVDKGHYVRMHRPLIGERMIITVEHSLAETLAVGDTLKVTADGLVAKAS